MHYQRLRSRLARLGLAILLATCFSGMALASSATPKQLVSALHWRSVGPYIGGVVIAVTGVEQVPHRYYMGSTGGGVWESNDYGQTWKNISDKYFDNNNIGAIAVAPSNPKVIYVGTGNPDIRNTMLTGDGMYKSTDGGKKWTKDGLAATHVISCIVVDPKNPNVVYAAAMGDVFAPNPQRGVYKSVNGGKTWKKILYVNKHTGAIDLVMDPKDPNVLYAAMWQAYRRPWTFSSGGPGSGIYKTTNGGATWTNMTHNKGLPKGIFGRVGLAIAPSNPKIMYAIVQAEYKGQAGGLFRSDNAGRSWKLVNNSMNLTQRAFYYSTVYVDPKNPNTIYLPQVAALWVSHDGGKKISKLHTPHGDNHSLWINPKNPKLMVEGNDGGATVSLNAGKTWSTEHNQPTGQFYHVNLDHQFPFWIYGSQQDSGTSVGPSAVRHGGIPPVWTRVQAAENSWVVPQPGKPWITYGSGYYSKLWRDNRRTGVVRNISPWPAYKFGVAASKVKYRYGWMHRPIVFAPGNANKLYVGANVVFESTDQGLHWTRISPDLTRNAKSKQRRPGGPISADVTGEQTFDTISSLAVSPVNERVIWTGSDDGLVYITTDSGRQWKQVRPSRLPKWSTITCIDPSHTHAGTAYLTASRFNWNDFRPYVYKTTDYGKHWTRITSGLPSNQYVESVRQDPNDPSLLFLGTSKTVYMSLDAGRHWLPLALNLPRVRVEDIAVQPAQHAVVLATFGRSFWILDNLQFLEQLNNAKVARNAPYLFKPQQTWLVTRTSGFRKQPDTGKNLPVGASVFFYLPANYSGQSVKLTFTNADGKLIRSFTLPEMNKKTHKPKKRLHAGMNRFLWNLRYPTDVDVKGVFNSYFSAAKPVGPRVVPGTYYVKLTYKGTTLKEPFEVKLDPRLKTTQAQLETRFQWLMKIHHAVGRLDKSLNQAIKTRSQLRKAIAHKQIGTDRAHRALKSLSREIKNLVDLKIQSGEGALVYPPRLRSWLTSIANSIGSAFVPPTVAQIRVAKMYIRKERHGVSRLQARISAAKAILKQESR